MITALVQFSLPEAITRAQAREIFRNTAPRYIDMPGLVRKYYILSEDGRTAGGMYLWRTREDAERVYDATWKTFVQEKYGAPPLLTFFDSPVQVDNLTHEILIDES
ncbi:MAG: YdhR family protein [Brachymonas denitrificans]|uniref:YdhR family protein n=1 Tax=Brachymonas denitrificans TaxID=28220 RepID=UPI002AFEFFE3|nr:YdhR family protein [Brachymonas denitrificans]